ncbi:MAG: S41 family peptidase, partial [Verrucomicrobiota bacterium]
RFLHKPMKKPLLPALLLNLLFSTAMADKDAEMALGDEAYEQIQILARAIEVIREQYVDEEKVTYERLIAGALDGMFASLDPHSSYMQPQVFQQLQRESSGTYDGVGITVAMRNDALRVIAAREDGAAAREGVLPGDVLLQIGETLTEKLDWTEAMELLRGEPGEMLRIIVSRPATKEILEFEIVRELIRETTVKDAMLLEEAMSGPSKIGYVRLLQFGAESARELANALDQLEDEGMEALVFDLRNNPGGLLTAAVEILGEFLPPDTTVVTTEGRNPRENPPAYRTPAVKRRERDYPVAVLVSHSSASASEVVAAALQDLKRAVIIGETTFGKGSVQQVMPMGMGTGAAMRLTTSKYYTPSRRVIHERGVTPDIISTLTPDEERLLAQWRNRANLDEDERAEVEHFQDRQLERAVDALKAFLIWEKKGTTPARRGRK